MIFLVGGTVELWDDLEAGVVTHDQAAQLNAAEVGTPARLVHF